MQNSIKPDKMYETIESFKLLFNKIDYCALILDETGKILDANEAALKKLDYSHQELCTKDILSIFTEKNHKETLKIIESAKNGREITFQTSFISKAGAAITLEMHIYKGRWNGYEVLFLLCRDKMAEKQEKMQKEYANMLLDTVPSAVYSVDINKKITSWNKMAEHMTGYKAEEVMGNPCYLFSQESCKDRCVLLENDVIKPIKGINCTIRNKKGEIRHISKNIDELKNEQGEIIGGIECFEDISERIHIEEQLRESEERYSAIVNSAPEIIIIHKQGIIVFINSAGIAASGFEKEELVGESIFKFLSGDSQKKVKSMIFQRLNGSKSEDYEIDFITKQKKKINLIVKATEITYEKEPASLAVLIDISTRKQFERELTQKDNILTAAAMSIKELLDNQNYYDAVSNCIKMLGQATLVDRVYLFQNFYDDEGNSTTSQILEWNSDSAEPQLYNPELQGIPFSEIESFIEPLKVGEAFYGIVDEFENDNTKELLKAQSIISIIVLPIIVRNKFWGFVGFDECKYERKWTDAEFWTLNAFTNSLGKAIERNLIEEELKLSQKSAETANNMKSRFLANMSHELRTPINGIMGFLEILNHTRLSSEQVEFLKEAKLASETLLYLVNDILDFSKIEAGRLHMEKINFSIRSTIEDAVSMHVLKADDKNIELHCIIKSSVPEEVTGDPGRLRQVLNNLIGNAIKFTEKGEINLTVECKGISDGIANMLFTVKDTGIGIKSEDVRKLFKPFIQVDDSTTRKFGGTGLGLAISRELVRMMDGEIDVESEWGVGSCFYFTAKYPVVSVKNSKIFDYQKLDGKRILIISDNPSNRISIKEYLEEAKCKVTQVDSKDKAMAALMTNTRVSERYDAVFLDQQLEGANIFQFSMSLKSIPVIKDIKFILLTSAAQKGDAEKAREYGFEGYISKPVKRNELLECISITLGMKSDKNEENMLVTKYVATENRRALKPKILLVEDNEMNCKVVTTMLKYKDMTCDIAADGSEALKAYSEKDYDIIFMDCQLPVMDGYQATAEIRKQEDGKKHTPIIAMTANAMDKDRKKCIEAGMDDYLSKPINFEKVFNLISKYFVPREAEYKRAAIIEENMQRFVTDTGFSQEDAEDLYISYMQSLSETFAKIGEALEKQDFEGVRKLAHQMKGASGNLRITKLYEASMQLEKDAFQESVEKSKATLKLIMEMFD